MIEITNKAAAELKALISTEEESQPAIRIYITGTSADAQYGLVSSQSSRIE